MKRMRKLVSVALVGFSAAVVAAIFAQAAPPVYFNHATIFVPSGVYAAMLESGFLRNEFSFFREGTNQRDGGASSFTAIYVSGQRTYLEFMKEGSVPDLGSKLGDLYFNMWIDDRSQLPLLRDLLAAERHDSTLMIRTVRNGQNAPSYDAVDPVGGAKHVLGPGMRVATVLKGYYPDGITREKGREGKFLPDRLLQNITGFTVTVNEAERNRLVQEFRAYSYPVNVSGERVTASSPDITFALLPSKPNASRILTVDMSLARPAGEQTYRFGRGSELRTQGNSARWTLTFSSD
jgi:hypothetical protein